jgi:hypothetical protein
MPWTLVLILILILIVVDTRISNVSGKHGTKTRSYAHGQLSWTNTASMHRVSHTTSPESLRDPVGQTEVHKMFRSHIYFILFIIPNSTSPDKPTGIQIYSS